MPLYVPCTSYTFSTHLIPSLPSTTSLSFINSSTQYAVIELLAKLQVRFSYHPLGRPTWTSAPSSVPLVPALRCRQVQYLNVKSDDICLLSCNISSQYIILKSPTSNASSDASSDQSDLPCCQETQRIRPSSSPTPWHTDLPNIFRTEEAVMALMEAAKTHGWG